MLRLTCLLGLICLTTVASAQSSENMVELGNWNVDTLPFYSDVWGYARDGREYALIGSRDYVHIIDVTVPEQPTEIAALNMFDDSGSAWRDIKVLGDYAYCVTETSEGLQIIDLGDLPNSAAVVYQTDAEFTRCHNIFIDDSVDPPRLYAFGSRPGDALRGYVVYSLANPVQPTLLAEVEIMNPDDGNVGYIHDGFARNDTLYANHGNPGMYAYDVSDPANPVEIGALTDYAEDGYNHSVWATDRGDILVMCDETTDTGVKVVSVDKSDPFVLGLEVESIFRSSSLAPNVASIAHNPYVLGDSLVVLSYYGEGVQVWDITDPTAPARRGFYDTTPNQNTYGGGVWGAYPWLPSGNILASDIDNGLFVLRLEEFQTLPVDYRRWTVTTDGKNALLEWSTAREENNAGWTVEHATDATSFTGIGWVAAGAANYVFTHPEPGHGRHYYRLRQTDRDGTETVSEIKTVTLAGGAVPTSLALYPNPAPAAAPVTASDVPGQPWQLLDGRGRTLRSGTGTIQTTGLEPGYYLVRMGGRTGRLMVR